MNTKNFLMSIAIAIAGLALFTGCGNNKQKNSHTSDRFSCGNIAYSNLLDKPTQDKVAKAMTDAGISPENIVSFFQNVNQFNEAIEGNGLVKSGFAKLDTVSPPYDKATMQTIWEEKYPDFIGYNCRITAFSLLSDFITVERPADKCPETLIFDERAIDHCGRTLFSSEERQAFRSLFGAIPTPYEKDLDKHLKNIRNDWRSKGIRFIHKNDTTKASLISVVMHSAITPDESFLFVGHTGVLLPLGDKLLFVEKLAFQEPYQAIVFNNRSELNDYLMEQYDIEWNQPTASPFLIENDELLEGYRADAN